MPRKPRLLAGLALLAALAAGPAAAHPHVWIDMRATLRFDDAGRITGMDVHWAFDEFYSIYVAEEIDPDGDGKGDRRMLRKLVDQTMVDLAEYRYFVFVHAGGERVPYGKVATYDSDLRDGRFIITFTLPFTAPVDPRKVPFTYAAYDPSYYIEVVHAKARPVTLAGAGAAGCAARIEEPNPTVEQTTLAAALDRNQTAEDGFGSLFAQTVHVACK
ncbi:MAG: DUF1007 family protein [Hyphomicrobiales bacterium]|nr:DUF1007 family protein [Hyphomicrobiales bacterium]MCP5371008.1 DUF1007 family protein [Hyphomicrobiales bacterium]